MKRGKKIVSVLCACVLMLAVVGLAASENAKAELEGKVVINYINRVDTTGTKGKIVEMFNASQDKIHVNFVDASANTDEYRALLMTSLASGKCEYDVYASDITWPAEFYEAGYCYPLDRLIERDGYDVDSFMQSVLKAYSYNGTQCAIPFFYNVGTLFYRSDIISEPPTTWDELITMATESVGKEGTTIAFCGEGAQYEGLVCGAIEFFSSYDAKVFDADGNLTINSPEVINALNKMDEVWEKCTPTNMSTLKNADITAIMQRGENVFARMWPMTWTNINNPEKSTTSGKWAVAKIPDGTATGRGTLGGYGMMLNPTTEHTNEAWEFIKFYCGYEAQKINAIEGGIMPTRQALYSDADVVSAYPVLGQLLEFAAAGVGRPQSTIYSSISEVMQIEISKMLAGNQTAEQAAANMETQMSALLSK